MSAQIYIHPSSREFASDLCARFAALGYQLEHTRRGFIQAQRIPVLRKVVSLRRRSKGKCPQSQ